MFFILFFERKIQMSSSKSPTFVQLRVNKLDTIKNCLLYLKRTKKANNNERQREKKSKTKKKNGAGAAEPMKNVHRRLPIMWKKEMVSFVYTNYS